MGPSCKTTLFLLMAISKPARSAGCDLAAERPRHWPRSGLVTLAAEHSANLITKHAAVRLKKPKIFFGRAPRARSAQPLRGSGAPRKAAPRPILALRLTRSASRARAWPTVGRHCHLHAVLCCVATPRSGCATK